MSEGGVSHPGPQVHCGCLPSLPGSLKMAVLRQLGLLLWKNYTVQVGARPGVPGPQEGCPEGR